MRKRFLLLTLAGLLVSLYVFLPRSLSYAPPQDSEFVYARIRYHMTPGAFMMRKAPWHHDYPYGDETLPTILGEVSFFFQAEDGIRDVAVTGVQTCALPI